MGFFSKLFARNLDEEPFMPGKPVVVGGFGLGRIARTEVINGTECFVVRMEHMPPRAQHLYVAGDGTGFPMRVPLGKDEAQRQLDLLVPREEPAEWAYIAENFADVRQRSRSASDLQRLLNHMYASVDLQKVDQKKMLEWAEHALFSELGLVLDRTVDSLREEIRARFKVPASPPKKSHAQGPLADAPLVPGLAPIGSFTVQKGLTVYDALSALETAEELALPDEVAQKLPLKQELQARTGTWHAYVRRAADNVIEALCVLHASVANAPPQLADKEVAVVAVDSQFFGIIDTATAQDVDFVAEEIEFSFEPFPRITDGRGVCLDQLPTGIYPIRASTEGSEVVALEVDFTTEPEPAPAEGGAN